MASAAAANSDPIRVELERRVMCLRVRDGDTRIRHRHQRVARARRPYGHDVDGVGQITRRDAWCPGDRIAVTAAVRRPVVDRGIAGRGADERPARLQKDRENKEFLEEVLQAFDFQLVGDEVFDDRPAYVLQVTPRVGYHPHGKYGKLLSRVGGKLWVDKLDFGWIRFDGQVTDSFVVDLFVARVQRGARLVLEQMPVGDSVWLPKRIELRAGARVLFVKNVDVDRILTYSDYRLSDDWYSVSR